MEQTITGATGTPIVLTVTAHPFLTGDFVYVRNVGGNTAANNTPINRHWVVTYVDANHFSLNGSTSGGAYTTGGAVNFCLPALIFTNAWAQKPYQAKTSFLTIRNDMPSGYRYATWVRDESHGLHSWDLTLSILTLQEARNLQLHFNRMQGQLFDFGYLDPENVYWPKCRFGQDSLELRYDGPSTASCSLAIQEIR